MDNKSKTVQLLEKIIMYCEQINHLTERFGKSIDNFNADFAYQHASAMCILQIGELASSLSDAFREKYNKIPWQQIRGMRNIFAHNYENMDNEVVWATIESKIPELKDYCETILSQEKSGI